jgi:plasmid stabilization system protein ParE
MIVTITEAAERDLEGIGDWIAQGNPNRAVTFVLELRRRCLALADAPRAYPLLPHHERTGVRRRVYNNYLIFYRIVDESIEVLRVIHGARDYEPILFPDNSD